MEQDQNSPVGNQSGASGNEEKKDVVAYETYAKTLAAERNAKERANSLEERLTELENEKLQKEGNHQEIIDRLKGENAGLKTQMQKDREDFLFSTVKSVVKTEAIKNGCQNPEKLIRLLDSSDFELLKAEGHEIKPETVSTLMEKAKKENPFLFKQGKVHFNDTVPSNNSPSESQSAELEKMTPDQLAEHIKKKFGNN